ncbi:putative malonic semialdehyde reductase RutE [Pigmentiphaga humi]|uniref:Putative NADH dehydrogenase/NAD(P)H nitroreductase PIGHUM_03381 n=1 Tax=Pigmentiphaga humi TaxID=2478468 RepID=A0A3P4B6R8_9BURK|nr:malonic semialdehyde reductase [Pigmentiphaga humi]VCU71300.1 putative malonic semialdehyde reductase RutE [Pigmentiphaga humi]
MAVIPQAALDQLFTSARTQNGWLDKPVSDEQLRQVYDIAKMGPTSMNCQPMRVVFLRTPEAKERLMPALSAGNVDKVKQAPVTAIVATDTRFYEFMPQIWFREGAKEMFEGNAALAAGTATRNATLQGAYLMVAARAVGLDCGPMSGFDVAKVNAEFFPDGRVTANFLCNLGHGDTAKLFDRQPRLSFEQAVTLL